MKTTAELACGDKVCLIDFGQTSSVYRQVLLSLGITRGVTIMVTRVAPLGCPIQIEVRGVSLAIRKSEAKYLRWETR